jgi:hypothetical protein
MDRTQMAAALQRVASVLYGEGAVPPTEGGLLFHELCEERRRAGDLYWTERRLHDLARELGLWPWSFSQIEVALRRSMGAASAQAARLPDSPAEI